MPIPMTASASRPSSTAVSTRRPASFRPSSATTSFGHRTRTSAVLVTAEHASRTARAETMPSSPASAASIRGRTPTLSIRFTPAGDDHVRPRRPRPAVCRSATTARPSPPLSPPSAASASRARSLVEPISAWNSMVRPIRRDGSAAARPGSVVHARIIAVQRLHSASDEPGRLRSRDLAARGPRACLLRHPALGRLAPGQLPRRSGQLRAPAGRVRRDLRHRRHARPHHRPRRGAAAGADARHGA